MDRISVKGYRASASNEIECRMPGRFSVLVGANNVGKTTLADSLYLSHKNVFPALTRPSSAALGAGERTVEISYAFSQDAEDEGPLGLQLLSQSWGAGPGDCAGGWSTDMIRRLGSVGGRTMPNDFREKVHLLYLPAWRNPLDELARREARILVELLRAQQQRMTNSRDLTTLRVRASALVEQLTKDGLIAAVEDRIATHLSSLTSGVNEQWAFVRGQAIDDSYLARVLELMLASLSGRDSARPLDVSGLGYVNLLHIAVVLAAIPDSRDAPPSDQTIPNSPAEGEGLGEEDDEVELARNRLVQAAAEKEAAEDSMFSTDPFHATVVIEEPEVHLHPQLQHSLVRYLRATVKARPELQVIISTHAPDIISSCLPEEIVVLRRSSDGKHQSRPIAKLPIKDRDRVLRMTRLHLDASRSSALLAQRVVLVEGVTDAAVLRSFGRAWAMNDAPRQAFIDALSIVPIGTKVGHWPIQLLATVDFELVDKVAVLRDSDKDFDERLTVPKWLREHNSDVVQLFQSHPTLEPAVTTGNEEIIASVLSNFGVKTVEVVTASSVHGLFRSRLVATEERPASPAGPMNSRKAEFALELADAVNQSVELGLSVSVPDHMRQLFDFLYPALAVENDVAESAEREFAEAVPW